MENNLVTLVIKKLKGLKNPDRKVKIFWCYFVGCIFSVVSVATIASYINNLPAPKDNVVYSDINKDGIEDKIIHSYKKTNAPIGGLGWRHTQEILYGVKRIYEIPTEQGIRRLEGVEYVTEEKFKELVSQ